MRNESSYLEQLQESQGENGAVETEGPFAGVHFIEVPDSAESTPVPLAFTIPERMAPREVEGLSVAWTAEALAAFATARNEALRNNRDFARNLPYASLRSLLEVAFAEIARLSPSVGLRNYEVEHASYRQPFLYLESSNVPRARQALRSVLHEWIVNYFAPQYAEPGHVSNATRDRLLSLRGEDGLLELRPFRATLLPWAHYPETGTTRPNDPDNFRQLADYVSHHLAGVELFPRGGKMRRIVSTQSITAGVAELLSDPIPMDGLGSFSFLVRVEVVTFPGVPQPLLTFSASKRRWLTDLKARPGSGQRTVSGFVLPKKNRDDRAFRFTLRYTKDAGGSWRWIPQNDYEALRSPMDLPAHAVDGQDIANGRLSTPERDVVLTYRDGVASKLHGIKAGVPERDLLDAFRAAAECLSPLGLEPFRGYLQVSNRKVKKGAEVRTLNDPTLLGAVLQLRAENLSRNFKPDYLSALSEEEIDQLLRAEIGRGLSSIRHWAKLLRGKQDQTGVLEAVIQENRQAIEALYPGERPLLLLLYPRERASDFRLLESVVRVLWGDAMEVRAQRLPDGVHGPRALLPGKDLSTRERAPERLRAWHGLAQQIGALSRRTFCLVMAQRDFYPVGDAFQADDVVNKPIGRQALASIGFAAVQYLLPPQESQEGTVNLTDFLHRTQAALRDLLLAHSGRIEIGAEVRERFFAPGTAPREVLGITIVRQHDAQVRSTPGSTFLPVAFRLDIESGRCEMRYAYEGNAGMVITPWQLLPEALCAIAGLNTLRIGKEPKERKNRFMRFCDEVISTSVQEGAQPVVIIDSSNTAQLWGWLSDRQLNPSNIVVADRERMQVNWKGARIVRIRQDLAPGIVIAKARTYRAWDSVEGREDVRVLRPTSEKALYRMNPTETGCVAYLSVANNRLHSNARGLSCYRRVLIDGGALSAYAGGHASQKTYQIRVREPYTDQWPTPNPLEIVVSLRQESDDPDQLARFVESLRYGFGHYGQWTALPAPLFFERVVRDYAVGYDLSSVLESEAEEEDGEEG